MVKNIYHFLVKFEFLTTQIFLRFIAINRDFGWSNIFTGHLRYSGQFCFHIDCPVHADFTVYAYTPTIHLYLYLYPSILQHSSPVLSHNSSATYLIDKCLLKIAQPFHIKSSLTSILVNYLNKYRHNLTYDQSQFSIRSYSSYISFGSNMPSVLVLTVGVQRTHVLQSTFVL